MHRHSLPVVSFIALAFLAAPAAAQTAAAGPDVVVSAARVPLPAREAGSAITVLTEEDLENRQVRFVGDVLRDIPGVAVSRSGGIGALTQIRIRGAEANQTLVLIDGIEMNNPASSSETDFQNILNAEIARIEVLRGPQSALYGSDAIGGVVNIITKRPGRGWSGTVRGEGGSFNTVDGLAHAGYGGERFYVTGGLSHYWTSGISIAEADNGATEKDHYRNLTGRIKAGATILPNLDIEAVAIQVASEREADSTISGNLLRDSREFSKTRQRYGLVAANWRLLGDAWEHRLRATYTSDESDFLNTSNTTTFISDGEKTKQDYQTSLFLESPSLNARHTLTFAAEHEVEKQFTWSSSNGDNRKSIENYGYVGEYRIAFHERLFLSGSLRYDDNDDLFDDQMTWRGTAAWLFNNGRSRLHASLGRGVKNPTLFELFGSTPTFTGNPNLVPEEAVGWDAGIEQSFFDGRVVADVTYFRNDIENLIDGNASTASNLAGTSETQGVELTLSATPLEQLSVDASYTYLDAQDANGLDLTRRARHIASVNALYRFTLDGRAAKANFGVRYNGAQRDTAFTDSFAKFNVELDGYTLVNAGLRWQVRDNIELFARAENVLDSNYQQLFGYGTPGFAVFAGLRVNFGPGAE